MGASHDTNTALAVGEFIIDEIITNSRSSAALSMKNKFEKCEAEFTNILPQINGLDNPRAAAILLSPALPLFPTRIFMAAHAKNMSLSLGAMGAMHGLVQFTEKVNYRGEWDHKAVIKERFGSEGTGEVVKRSDGGGLRPGMLYHRYEDYAYYFDIWSNIHYGYIGCFVGISQWLLRNAAGLVQPGDDNYMVRGLNHMVGKRKMSDYDDPMDQVSIEIGIRLYKRFTLPSEGIREKMLTALMKEVSSAPYEYYHKVAWSRLEPCLKEPEHTAKPEPVEPKPVGYVPFSSAADSLYRSSRAF